MVAGDILIEENGDIPAALKIPHDLFERPLTTDYPIPGSFTGCAPPSIHPGQGKVTHNEAYRMAVHRHTVGEELKTSEMTGGDDYSLTRVLPLYRLKAGQKRTIDMLPNPRRIKAMKPREIEQHPRERLLRFPAPGLPPFSVFFRKGER
jgi:hypothetical protein